MSHGPNSNALVYAECALSTYRRSTLTLITLFVVHRICFVQRRKGRSRQSRLDFVAIFIGSRNIRAQTQKLS